MGDARTERWKEHRAEMRRQLVDAAIRAIEEIGPQVSMREIAVEAKVPKPTIYRFFKDKSELATAIAERAREDIVLKLASVRQHAPGTVGGLLHTALTGYASLLVEHPNVARFLFMGVDNPGVKAAENWQAIAREVATLVTIVIEECGGKGRGDFMFHSAMISGAVTGAADSWFAASEPAGPADEFVARVEPAVHALIQLAAAEVNVIVDFDTPLSGALSGEASVG